MRLMTITVQLAFFDAAERTVDNVADYLVRWACDGIDAEIAYTSERMQRDIDISDPNEEDADDPYEAWQIKAREEMP